MFLSGAFQRFDSHNTRHLASDVDTARGLLVEVTPRRAFAVHLLTASGAAIAFLAMMAAVARDWPAMFGWLGLALFVDGIDGPLARKFSVVTVLPRWSGDVLDLVVDFLTYVFVPAYAIANAGVVPDLLAVPAAVAIVFTSALYFADRQMKTDDNYFRGFPALWNAVAFYLILLPRVPWLGAAVIAVLLVATFLRFPFVHPFRVRRLRSVTLALLAAWGVLAIIAILSGMAPGPWVTAALCAIAGYVVGIGALRRRV
jgi:phosphatidylcholine synthase